MFTVTSSVLGKPQNPEGVKQAIDQLIASRNPTAPKVGETYVRYGLKFNIRPEFAAVQSIYETGWYRFGGQVKAEWHNPAGLKYEGQFLRFGSWEEGIHAHYERLSCYVRPKPVTGEGLYDPGSRGINAHWRYYEVLKRGYRPDTPAGIASLWTAENSPIYADKVVGIMNEILVKVTPSPPISPPQVQGIDWKGVAIAAAGIGILAWMRSGISSENFSKGLFLLALPGIP